MIYDWYKIFNKTEFDALDIPSKEYSVILEGLGLRDILVTKGNLYSIKYEGAADPENPDQDTTVFLSAELNGENPFEFSEHGESTGHAIYVDDDDNVWLGIEAES